VESSNKGWPAGGERTEKGGRGLSGGLLNKFKPDSKSLTLDLELYQKSYQEKGIKGGG